MDSIDVKVLKSAELGSNLLNVSENDLRTQQTQLTRKKPLNIVRYVPSSDGVGLEKETLTSGEFIESVFLYFPVQENDKSIQLFYKEGSVLVSLDPQKYGFPIDTKVQIDPQYIDLELNERSRNLYDSVLSNDNPNLNYLLDSVAKIVNDSMEYDVHRLTNVIDAEDKLSDSVYDYSPVGDEVQLGICVDAGKQIRNLLGSLNLESRIGGSYVSANGSNSNISHDTTLVFDKERGHWAVLNSKSATKNYNLTPKEKLSELGSPFY